MGKRSEHHELARRASEGDSPAFRALYGAFRGPVEKQLRRMLGPEADIEAVRQEVFVQIIRSLGRFRYDSSLSTWIYGLTRNVALSALRATRRDLPKQESASVEVPLGRLEARDLLRKLYAALDELSPVQREAIVMHDIERKSMAEIADITDSPLSTVASRVRRGRLVLVDRFRQKEGDKEPSTSGPRAEKAG